MGTEITSKENYNVKYAYKLLNSARFRKEEGKFIIEGIRLCREAFENSAKADTVFYTEECYKKSCTLLNGIIKSAKCSYKVSESIINHISGTKTPQGIVSICSVENNIISNEKIKKFNKVVLLENIQDPSNLGGIFRTCDAFGIDLVAVTDNGCDIYSPKVLRGSMGALFRLNVVSVNDLKDVISILKKFEFKVYAAALSEDSVDVRSVQTGGKTAVAFGNEGKGLTEAVINSCTGKIAVPMNLLTESLNVSVAAGIIIWEISMRRKEEL